MKRRLSSLRIGGGEEEIEDGKDVANEAVTEEEQLQPVERKTPENAGAVERLDTF